MPHHLITKADGSVAILITDDDSIGPADEIAKWGAELQSKVVGHEPIDRATIPTDRYFRNAWSRTSPGRIDVDMPKAREIHRDVLRRMRAPLFGEPDVDYVKADEAGDEAAKASVRSYKQALRDVPQDPRIDAAETPEELKAIVPDVLKTPMRDFLKKSSRARKK